MLALLLLYLSLVDGRGFNSDHPYNYDPSYFHNAPISYKVPYIFRAGFDTRSAKLYERKPDILYSTRLSSPPYSTYGNIPRQPQNSIYPPVHFIYLPFYSFSPFPLEPFDETLREYNAGPYPYEQLGNYPSYSPFVHPIQNPHPLPFGYPPPLPYPNRKPQQYQQHTTYPYALFSIPFKTTQQYPVPPLNPLASLTNPFERHQTHPIQPIPSEHYNLPLSYPTSQYLYNPHQPLQPHPLVHPEQYNKLLSNTTSQNPQNPINFVSKNLTHQYMTPQQYPIPPSNPLEPLTNPFGSHQTYPYNPTLPELYNMPLSQLTRQHIINPYEPPQLYPNTLQFSNQDSNPPYPYPYGKPLNHNVAAVNTPKKNLDPFLDQIKQTKLSIPSSKELSNRNNVHIGIQSVVNAQETSTNKPVDELFTSKPPIVELNHGVLEPPNKSSTSEKSQDTASKQESPIRSRRAPDPLPKNIKGNYEEPEILGKYEYTLREKINLKTAMIASLIDREHLSFKENAMSTYQKANELLDEDQARNITNEHIQKTINKLLPLIIELKDLTKNKKNSMNEVSRHFIGDHMVPLLMAEMYPSDQKETPEVVDKLANELYNGAKNKIMHIFGL